MQKGHHLQFECQECKHPIHFSIFELDKHHRELTCTKCGVVYNFRSEDLRRQLRLFEGLCRQIHDSEEILANTSVGINIGDKEVRIPYKILLSRLNSALDLKIGDQQLRISFRIEPSQDLKN